jgi:methionyl-tRNA synthetase
MPATLHVTTAIPYVNAPPHLGFALELVLADAIARHARARGVEVRFSSGTDDNSLKNVRAAEAAGVATRALVDANADRFRALGSVLDLSIDDFVRTSADPRHDAAVAALWRACARAGDLERRSYRGEYCVGCERFIDASELEDGLCPEHRTPPETVEEENWFFRLSRYERPIAEALESGRLRVHPPERAREALAFVRAGLRDVSVSRSQTRARGWGIPVPGDPTQVVHVWFDALAYYLASAGFADDPARLARLWAPGARRVHVIGKGILRFHAALWPALLLSAGLTLPSDLAVHGYLTVNGRKIGKSLGNALDPSVVAGAWGTDALRYFLLRHIGPTQDGDFDEARLARAYRAELADALGNLVARTAALAARCGPPRHEPGVDARGDALVACARALPARVDDAIARLSPDAALRAIWEVVGAANRHLNETAPWDAARTDAERSASVGAAVTALEILGAELGPFLPATARAIARRLADPSARLPVLFPKDRAREPHVA